MNGLEKKRARVSGGEMAYLDEGDPGNPAVVFLHGFPTSSFLWREFVPLLAPWFRVVAPDLLGAGDSEKPEGAELHIRAQAGYVRELLPRLGIEEFAVVGHSHGGGIAQLLAFEGVVKAMVLLDSVGFDAWPSEPTQELQRLAPDQEREAIVRAVIATAFELGMGRRSRLTDELLEEYRRPFAGEEGAGAFFRAARADDGVGLSGREENLARLEIPVLIVWGEDDPFTTALVAERLSEAIPNSTLALLPGCSHFVTEDAPETVAQLLLEYLRSRYLGRDHDHEQPGPVGVRLERRPPGGEPS